VNRLGVEFGWKNKGDTDIAFEFSFLEHFGLPLIAPVLV
jgi:hypothetical protein